MADNNELIEEEPTKRKSISDLVPVSCSDPNLSMFLDSNEFDQSFRSARLLSSAKGLVPKEYEGNPANCMLALSMAKTLRITPFMFFQWAYPVNGKFGLEAKAVISIANQSGMFKHGIEFEEIGTKADGDSWGFRAYAEDVRTGKTIEEIFTIGDARSAGWLGNTWWKKLPRMMLKYRSASFLIKFNRPELLGGMGVYEEMRDGEPTLTVKDITKEVEEIPEAQPLPDSQTPPKKTEKPKANGRKANGNGAAKTHKEEPPKEEDKPTVFQELRALCNSNVSLMNKAIEDGLIQKGEIAQVCRENNTERATEILKVIKSYIPREGDWLDDLEPEVKRLHEVYNDPANEARVQKAMMSGVFESGEVEKVIENNDSVRADVIREGIEKTMVKA
jgi:hypothetical protein